MPDDENSACTRQPAESRESRVLIIRKGCGPPKVTVQCWSTVAKVAVVVFAVAVAAQVVVECQCRKQDR